MFNYYDHFVFKKSDKIFARNTFFKKTYSLTFIKYFLLKSEFV